MNTPHYLTANGFVPQPSSEYNDLLMVNLFTCRYVWKDKIEIGAYRVMFGYRLRAGWVGEDYYELDICCGAKAPDYWAMFAKIVAIMLANGIDDPFKDIPRYSRIKPYMKDEEFVNKIEQLLLRTRK